MKRSKSAPSRAAGAWTRRSFLHRAAAGVSALAATTVLTRGAVPPAKPKHILLANCWHDINIGDIAHAPGMLRLIETHLAGVRVTLWPNPTYPDPGPQRAWSEAARAMVAKAFPTVTILEAGGVKKGRAISPELVAAIERADLLISGSGGFHGKPVDVWRAASRKPFGGYGNTFSSPTNPLYAEAAFLYCRDSPSVELLKRGGVKGPEIAFGPDSTFSLHLRDEARAEAYLRSVGLESKAFLCVIPRLRHSPYPEIYGYAPSETEKQNARVNQEFKRADHAATRELIINWVRSTGLKVLACPEMIYGVPLAKEEFVDRLPTDVRSRVVWRDSFWLCDEAASVFARAIAVVSLDCHSPIIALTNGTPAIHLRVPTDNAFKSRMFADIGLPEWVHENEGMTGERLTQMVMAIQRDPAGAGRKVQRAMAFVRERQSATLATIRKVLAM